MLYQVVALRDIKTGIFMPPQFVPHVAVAVRGFGDEVNSGQRTPLAMHASDFELWKFGEWNDQTGLFETGSAELIISGASVKRGEVLPPNVPGANGDKYSHLDYPSEDR